MDHMLSAASREIMDARLEEMGLLATDAQGETHAVPRVSVTGYGGASVPVIWATKPTYDEAGAPVIAGVLHADYHCNIRDMAGLVPDVVIDAFGAEVSPWGEDVVVIDPQTVTTPAVVWG